MGRSKNPEQTIEQIVQTATTLFIEKGYEHTSIQDILSLLNLSKGGLYHHFKSKDEILDAVMLKRANDIEAMLQYIIEHTKAATAKEKLEKILLYIAKDTKTHALDTVLKSQAGNSHFVVSGMKNCIKLDAPIFQKLIQDGIEDGSLQVMNAKLCAEVFLLLLNYWINPVLFSLTTEETKERLLYLQTLLRTLGLDIMSENFISLIIKDYEKMGALPITD